MPFDAIPNTTIETNPNAEALELARKVAEILAVPERWCQHTLCDGDAACLLGAIGIAGGAEVIGFGVMTGGLFLSYPDCAVRSRMAQLCDKDVADFNDDPLRTHADIVALTRAVVASFE